jgi:hypothetical protein
MVRKYPMRFLLFAIMFSCNAKREETSITMTGQTLETPFPLASGIQIDELQVDTFKNGLPYVFYLKEALLLARLQPGENIGYLKNVLFFDRPNRGYTWRNDSTWGIFDIDLVEYKYRGAVAKRDRLDYTYEAKYDVYPTTFKPGAWYLFDFKQDDRHRDFMYVDTMGNATNYKFFRLK